MRDLLSVLPDGDDPAKAQDHKNSEMLGQDNAGLTDKSQKYFCTCI